jgi:class III poly(R)-hydroxyalkanoic acid synthase PhaE subunit
MAAFGLPAFAMPPGMADGMAGAGNPFAQAGGFGALPSAFTGLFNAPALGPAREQQQSFQRLSQLAARCGQAQLAVVNHWNDIIGKALRELGERLAPKLKSGATPASVKEVYDLWVDSAEGVYAQAARNAGFVQAQAELTNALSSLRGAQRELVEEWSKQFDLPTRAEINSIHQQLRELKAALKG